MDTEYPKLMDLYYSYKGDEDEKFFTQIPYELSQVPREYDEYENDLSLLDPTNYEIFKKDLLTWVGDSIKDKFKELKGFKYLKESGATNIKYLEPNNEHKMPDLLATFSEINDTILEVKSINNSDDDKRMWNELAKNKATAKSTIICLNAALKQKMRDSINTALEQLSSYPETTVNKIILLVIALDTNNAFSEQNWIDLENFLKEIARNQSSVKMVWYYHRFGKDIRNELGLTGLLTL